MGSTDGGECKNHCYVVDVMMCYVSYGVCVFIYVDT